MTDPIRKLLSGFQKNKPEGPIAGEEKEDRKKKPVSRKQIFQVIGFLFFLAALWFAARALTNAAFVRDLERDIYYTDNESRIMVLNWPEGRVPAYNMGNAFYEQGDYESAQGFYVYALRQDLKEGEECPIRINLALSLLATIRYDHLEEPSVRSKAIQTLNTARGVLLEEGCAADGEETGHSPEAQKLKEEIDALLAQIQDPDEIRKEEGEEQDQPQEGEEEEDQGGGSDGEDKEKDQHAGTEWENHLREKLQEQRDAAAEENAKQQSAYESYQQEKEQGESYGQDQDKGDFW